MGDTFGTATIGLSIQHVADQWSLDNPTKAVHGEREYTGSVAFYSGLSLPKSVTVDLNSISVNLPQRDAEFRSDPDFHHSTKSNIVERRESLSW